MNDEGIINKEYRQEILQKAITQYGEAAQVLKAIEELAELIQELYVTLDATDVATRYALANMCINARYIKNVCKEVVDYVTIDAAFVGREEVSTEIADVRIMLQQLEMFLVKPEEVQEQIDFKVKRLEERLNNG